MGQNQVIVLGNVIENRTGGAGGTHCIRSIDIREQCQAADNVVHVHIHFHNHIRVINTHMGQVVLHIADGTGINTAAEGLVQDFTIQRIPENFRFGRLCGHFRVFLRSHVRSRFSGNFIGRFLCSTGSHIDPAACNIGIFAAAAAQQQRQDQNPCNHSFHSHVHSLSKNHSYSISIRVPSMVFPRE